MSLRGQPKEHEQSESENNLHDELGRRERKRKRGRDARGRGGWGGWGSGDCVRRRTFAIVGSQWNRWPTNYVARLTYYVVALAGSTSRNKGKEK